MAAPADITIKDLSGTWVLNKTLSDDTDSVLALQGIGWLTRKAIAMATITLHIKQYEKDGVTHIDISQVATGGIKTQEDRTLNYEWAEHVDSVFGKLRGRSRFSAIGGVEDDFLKSGWEEGTTDIVESYAINDKAGWDGLQIWGFEIIDGVRYYTRHVVITKGKEVKKVRMVYDYKGPLEL